MESPRNLTENTPWWKESAPIAGFGVLALYLTMLALRHARYGVQSFFDPDTPTLEGLLYAPVLSVGPVATYILVTCLMVLMVLLWLHRDVDHGARRAVGLLLLLLAVSGFMGVLDGDGEFLGGLFGSNIAWFFQLVGRPLAFLLAAGLLVFAGFVARDWFFYSSLRGWLGSSASPAFAVGMSGAATAAASGGGGLRAERERADVDDDDDDEDVRPEPRSVVSATGLITPEPDVRPWNPSKSLSTTAPDLDLDDDGIDSLAGDIRPVTAIQTVARERPDGRSARPADRGRAALEKETLEIPIVTLDDDEAAAAADGPDVLAVPVEAHPVATPPIAQVPVEAAAKPTEDEVVEDEDGENVDFFTAEIDFDDLPDMFATDQGAVAVAAVETATAPAETPTEVDGLPTGAALYADLAEVERAAALEDDVEEEEDDDDMLLEVDELDDEDEDQVALFEDDEDEDDDDDDVAFLDDDDAALLEEEELEDEDEDDIALIEEDALEDEEDDDTLLEADEEDEEEALLEAGGLDDDEEDDDEPLAFGTLEEDDETVEDLQDVLVGIETEEDSSTRTLSQEVQLLFDDGPAPVAEAEVQDGEVEEDAPGETEEVDLTAEPTAASSILQYADSATRVDDRSADPAPVSRRRPAAGPAEDEWAAWLDDDRPAPSRPPLRPISGAAESLIAEPGGDSELYHSAVELCLTEGRCSISLLQRSLGLSFGDAAACIERMESEGLVGPYRGTGNREILSDLDDWISRKG